MIYHYGTLSTNTNTNKSYGYHYLIYYILLEIPEYNFDKIKNLDLQNDLNIFNDVKCMISNSYLLIPKKIKDKRFSLFFPTGLSFTKDKTKCLISCGEGDYNSFYYIENIDDIVNKCNHNINDLNIENYNFEFIQC